MLSKRLLIYCHNAFLIVCEGALEQGCTGMYFSVPKPWSVLLDVCHPCTDICKHSHLTASCLSVVASKSIRISSEEFQSSLSVIKSREPWVPGDWHAPWHWHLTKRELLCAPTYPCKHTQVHLHGTIHMQTLARHIPICAHTNILKERRCQF